MPAWRQQIAVYGAGEAINGSGALAPYIRRQLQNLARIATNRTVAATAQLDADGGPSIRYVLDPRGRMPIESLPNINTGNPINLLNFVSWCTAICPANQMVLVLSGHGMAWEDSEADAVLGLTRGPGAPSRRPGAINHPRAIFGRDVSKISAISRAVLIDGHDRDYLSNAELGVACQRISAARGGAIDILVFDACLMCSLEILQELRGSVLTVVGAIDEISASGIDMAGPAVWLTAAEGPNASEIASYIAGNFKPATAFDSCVAVDISRAEWAEGLIYFRDFSAGLVQWASDSQPNIALLRAALRLASTSIVQYSRGGLSDFSSLIAALTSISGLPQDVVQNGKRAEIAFRATVIKISTGADYRNACGLSIFSPGSENVYYNNIAEYSRLRFPTLTGWTAVLNVIFGVSSDDARLSSSFALER